MYATISQGCYGGVCTSAVKLAITCPFASMRCHFALWLIIRFSVVAIVHQQAKRKNARFGVRPVFAARSLTPPPSFAFHFFRGVPPISPHLNYPT